MGCSVVSVVVESFFHSNFSYFASSIVFPAMKVNPWLGRSRVPMGHLEWVFSSWKPMVAKPDALLRTGELNHICRAYKFPDFNRSPGVGVQASIGEKTIILSFSTQCKKRPRVQNEDLMKIREEE